MSDRKGLYIHIPFCLSKCGYCAFNSYPVAAYDPPLYLAALYREIDFWSGRAGDEIFDSLFIGGGTPTILPTRELTGLLTLLREKFVIGADAEISVETNPNTVDPGKLRELRQFGVNRLSIGIQSFCDSTLQLINRSHTGADGRNAIAMAREAGFANLNLDLIYGLPGQTPATWRETLEEALSLNPEHLAAYQLSIDPGSGFAEQVEGGLLRLPDEEATATMAEQTLATVFSAGLERYEISNYARPDCRCRHNLIYWHNGSYLGLGAGAVSNWSGLRIRNLADPNHYVKRLLNREPPWQEAEALAREPSFRETVIMGLRLLEGLDLSGLQKRFGINPEEYYGETLRKLVKRNLLTIEGDRLRLTETALPFANQVLAELV
ncbi:MAG: radical SAM family heme chaperone HemW [Desulfobulbales bacterium]|nr:radical SAM family heme chaperone HemW [Desulfobulbales bacterium]